MYEEALEKQLELLKIWHGSQGEQWSARIAPGILTVERAAPTPRDVQRLEIYELENAECFFVARKICEVVEVAAATFPDIPLLPQIVPTANGWVYLEKACPVGPPSQVERAVFGNPPRLKAFSWGYQGTLKDGKEYEGIGLTYYEDGMPFPYPLAISNWSFGVNWDSDWDKADISHTTDIEYEVLKKRLSDMGRYIMTLFTFINQKLLVVSHQRTGRGARRRYEQEHGGAEAPLIRVVLLRARKTLPSGEHHDIEWSCRWLVRGHWRQQWYPSLTNHKAIWITPYVKGPEDKPLKRPGHTLFAVVR